MMLNQMTKAQGIAALKKIAPDAAKVGKAVFMAMAYVDTIRPIVDGYQRKILTEEKYAYAEKWHDRMGKTYAEWITEPNETYLMEENDFAHYAKRCNEEMTKAGLRVEKEGNCPLLVAEHLLIKAKQALIDTMEPVTGIKHSDLFHHGVDDYNNYIEMTLRWLAPLIK
jgi:hypothetical protein